MITLDSLSVRRRSMLAIVGATASLVLVRGAASGIGVVSRGRAVVHWRALFGLLLLGSLAGLGVVRSAVNEDVFHTSAAATIAVFVVLRHAFILVCVGELGDYVPGVDEAGDLEGNRGLAGFVQQ